MMLHHQNVPTVLKDQVTRQQQGEMFANQEATGKAVRPGTYGAGGHGKTSLLEDGKGARFVTLFRDGIVFLLEVPRARPKVCEIYP